MKRLILATLMLALTAAMASVSLAYALDMPPLTVNFNNVDIPAASVNLGSVRISWSQLHLNFKLVLTPDLAVLTFRDGTFAKDFAIQGSVNATLVGTHRFTGTVKIHLSGNAPPEIVDFHID